MTHQEIVEKDFQRNRLIFVLHEFFWGFGVAFAAYNTMVPGYLAQLGAPKSVIGLIQTLPIFLAPLQVFSASIITAGMRKKIFIIITFLGILSYVVFAGVSILFIPADLYGILVAGFSISSGLFMAMIIIGNPILFGMLTDNVPLKRRGRVFGYRVLALGISTVFMGFLAGYLLKTTVFPLNYQITFLIGGTFYLFSGLLVFLVRDHVNPAGSTVVLNRPVLQLYKQLKRAWINPNYRVFIFFHLLNVSAITLAAFIIPFGVNRMSVTPGQISLLAMLYFAGLGFGGFFAGRIADAFGYRLVMIVQSICLSVFFVIVINAGSFTLIAVAYTLFALPAVVSLMVLTNLSVEILPGVAPGTLTIMGNLLVLPVAGVIAPVSGALIDYGVPYSSVFLVGLILSLVALGGIIALVKEPRKGRVYVIKRIPRR
jgi:MFS family permease